MKPQIRRPLTWTRIIAYVAFLTLPVGLAFPQTELVTNGGFESASTGWLSSGNFYADSRFAYSHSGNGYAYVSKPDGQPGNNLSGTMYQSVTIPANATSATLTFWYNITSEETIQTPFDVLNITLKDSNGGYLATVAVFSNLHKDSAPGNPFYHQKSFDMTSYKGQTVRLHFLATTDGSKPTVFRVDDVSIIAAVPPLTVESTCPADGDLAAAVTDTITATFSENIQVGTLSVLIVDETGASVPIKSVTVSGRTLTISLRDILAHSTGYGVGIDAGAVKNLAGNPNLEYSWAFITAAPEPPDKPTLISPLNNAPNVSITPTLRWQLVSRATGYAVQVSRDRAFTDVVFQQATENTSVQVSLARNTPYFWRVLAAINLVVGPWSDVWTFTTIPFVPVADFSFSPTTGCAPLTVQFTDTSLNNPTSWSWNFGDRGTSSQRNPSHTYSSAGSYNVTLTVSNAAGSNSKAKTIAVKGAPVANFSFIPTSGCAPLPVSFNDQSSNSPTNWSWSFGDGGTSTQRNPSYTYQTGGSNYTITLTVSNSCGSSSISKTIYVDTVKVKIQLAKQEIAVGETTTFDVLIESVSNLGGFEFKLRYNSNIIEIREENVQKGNFVSSSYFHALGPHFKNVDGLRELTYGVSFLGEQPGPNGDGTLARITVKGKNAGKTVLDLTDIRVIGASPEINEIPLADVIDGAITVIVSTGTIRVTINPSDVQGVTFDIIGPTNYSGSGTSWSRTDAPVGNYTIIYGDVTGYTRPASETKTLSAGGSISFIGTYIDNIAPTPNFIAFISAISATRIDITSAEATDPTPPIYYHLDGQFYNGASWIDDDGGVSDYDWSTIRPSPFTDAGLFENGLYRYRQQVKDSASPANESTWSGWQEKATLLNPPEDAEISFSNVTEAGLHIIVASPPKPSGSGQTAAYFDLITGVGKGIGTADRDWADDYTAEYSNLEPNTQYGLRVKDRNYDGVETAYNPTEQKKYTLANKASAPTVSNPASTTLDVNVNPNGNPNYTLFAIYNATAGYYVNADGGSNGSSPLWQTDNAWGTVTVKNLTPDTIYNFNVKAKNEEGVLTDFGPIGSGKTNPLPNTLPTASNLSISPASPLTGDDLVGNYSYNDADGDPESGTETKWYKEGILQPDYNDQLTIPSNASTKDEVWYFTVKPKDGVSFGNLVTSPSVTIGNTPPIASNLSVSPSELLTGDNLTAGYTYTDADGDKESGTEIRWYKNDTVQIAYNDKTIVPATATSKGETWHFAVKPKDGSDFGDLTTSSKVTVRNTPPSITSASITSDTEPVVETSILTATAAGWSDPDNDPEGYKYQWYNQSGAITGATSSTLDGNFFNKSDEIYCMVAPFDGTDEGGIKESNRITIANSSPTAPVVNITPEAPKTADNLTLQIVTPSSDADGDNITYSYAWYKNDVLQLDLTADIVQASKTAKGEIWRCIVTPNDGTANGASGEDSVTVNNSPPTAPTVDVTPDSPTTNDDIVCMITGPSTDADGDTIIYTYNWYKDGILQPALTANTVPSSETTKGQVWKCVVTPNDGTVDGPSDQDSVTIRNSAPVASGLAITPPLALTGDNLIASYIYSDADGDGESGSEIRWYKDNTLQSAYNNQLIVPFAATSKGEIWYLTVEPNDGTDFGALQTSDPVTIGNTPPVASNLSVSPSSPLTGNDLTLGYAYSDADGDTESGTETKWYKDGVVQTPYNDQKTVPSIATAKGQQWHFTVKPKDGTDFGALQTSDPVTIGNTPPVADAQVVTEKNRLVAGSPIEFDGSGSSDVDGDQLTFRWDFGDGGTGTGVSPAHIYANLDTYTITLIVNDGDEDSAPAMTTVEIKPPSSIALLVPNGSEMIKGGSGCIITWSTTGSGIGHIHLLYSIDSGNTYPSTIVASTENDGIYTWTLPTLDSGTVRVKAIAEDSSNTELAADVSDSDFMIDSTTPETSVASLEGTQGENGWYTSDVIVILSATDNLSGVKKIRYKTNDDAWQTYSESFIISKEGITTISYYSEDNVGNKEIEKSEETKIDKTKPTGTISINNGADYTKSLSVTLTLSASGASSGMGTGAEMQFSNDGSSWSTPEPYSAAKQWELTDSDGLKTVYVKFKDEAGIWSNVFSDSITLDTIPPTNPTSCTETHGVQSGVPQIDVDDPSFTWSGASDEISGVGAYYYYWGPDPNGVSSNYTTYTGHDPPAVSEGTHYLRVKTKDNAGNEASWKTLFVFIYSTSDTQPPTPNTIAVVAVSATQIDLTSTEATDDTPPVCYRLDGQYYDSTSWVDSGGGVSTYDYSTSRPNPWPDTNLVENGWYRYCQQVKDSATPPNESTWSDWVEKATLLNPPEDAEISFSNVTETGLHIIVASPPKPSGSGQTAAYFDLITGQGQGSGAIDRDWADAYTAEYSNLNPNTQYGFRVKYRNYDGVETAYNPTEQKKYTLANKASAPTVSNATSTTLDVNVNPNGNPEYTLFAVYNATGGYYVDANGESNENPPVWQIDSDWGTVTVKNLTPDTVYEFKVKAKNEEGVLADFGPIGSGKTNPPPNMPPTISGLPDKILNEDSSLDNAIDLWACTLDAETADSGLTFSITGNTNPNCGVGIDSNRYKGFANDVEPHEHYVL